MGPSEIFISDQEEKEYVIFRISCLEDISSVVFDIL